MESSAGLRTGADGVILRFTGGVLVMKKKLVCLLLGIVMLMSCVLTGCNKATDSDDDDTTDDE